ncbi:MAG: hypothetical protein ACREVK_10470 [Gammaproteobacteria bacterium]
MNKLNIEWPVIRGALGVFSLCLLLNALLLVSTFYFRNAMKRDYEAHDHQFKAVSREYLNVDVDERIINDQYPKFIKLYNKGIIGEEKRLNWVETLENAKTTLKVPQLSYRIDTRKRYQPDFPLATGAYEIYTSGMKLDLGMLHENDLKRLLDILDREASGLYSVAKCALSRKEKTIALDPEKANLHADCNLVWYSIKLSGNREIKL